MVLALVGCGRINFDEQPDAFDRCAGEQIDLGTWSSPVSVDAINATGAQNDDPEPSADGLELYFTSPRPGSLGMGDLWRVRRASPGDPWGTPEHLDDPLSSTANENTPGLSSDGLELWFASDRRGTQMDDLYVATRAAVDQPWGPPVLVGELVSDDHDRGPSLFDDDLAMVFHSGRGTGGSELFVTRRPTRSGSWSVPEKLEPPDTPGEELRGWMSPCGFELYFESSTRTGTGGMDFFRVTRARLDDPFSGEIEVRELDTEAFEQDLRLLPDRRRAYFSSDRNGRFEIFETTR
jgi:hypothetical protein